MAGMLPSRVRIHKATILPILLFLSLNKLLTMVKY